MKTNITKIFTIIIVLILFNSCKKKEEYSTELRFPEFDNITVLNALEVEVKYGQAQSVIIVGEEEDVKSVTSEVKSNTLILDIDYENKSSLKYIITLPILKELNNKTNATIKIGDFEQDGFLSIISSNNGIIELGRFKNVELLKIDISGTSTVNGNSPFDNLIDLNIKQAEYASYNSYTIQTENAIIEINGNGSCYTYVNKSLTAKINGEGTIYYKGEAFVYSNTEDTTRVVKVE